MLQRILLKQVLRAPIWIEFERAGRLPRYQELNWYEQALFYDIIFDVDSEQEAQFIVDAMQRYGCTDGNRILEPACGSGRLILPLAKRGHDVTGFDISQEMLHFAQRRCTSFSDNVTLKIARMEDFRFRRRFDCAHCFVSTFKHLLDEDAAQSHLRCVARALKPGGIYILGMHITEYADNSRARERWTGQRDGTHVVCNIQSWPADRKSRTEQVRSRLVVTRNGSVERYESHWTFRTYSFRQLKSLLRSVPEFEHVATHDFHCEIDEPIPFDGLHMDNVLILRRR